MRHAWRASRRRAARAAAAGGGAGLEAQQAALLEALRAARGAPVAFDELRRLGIEFPAAVASELQVVGVPVELGAGGARLPPGAPVEAFALVRQPVRAATRGRLMSGLGAVAAVIGLLAAVGLLVPGAARPPARTAAHRAAPPTEIAPGRTVRPAAPRARPQRPRRAAVPVSLALATALDMRGHRLLLSGDYAGALGPLREAIAATGERLSNCLEPVGERCLIYAYALYDVGRDLAVSGRAHAAVTLLERRLRIHNQPAVVRATLAQARSRAAREPTAPTPRA